MKKIIKTKIIELNPDERKRIDGLKVGLSNQKIINKFLKIKKHEK
jgi:hypothetical protein|tara:strand:+ start:7119 stop:7253 length:135 start_codon:yes stop_codon:yes gene_type:complete